MVILMLGGAQIDQIAKQVSIFKNESYLTDTLAVIVQNWVDEFR